MTRRITSVPERPRPPVRVRLRRITANQSKAYPPDGAGQDLVGALEESLWHRLQRFRQCLAISIAVGGSIALQRDFGNRYERRPSLIEAAAPKDEIEGVLAVQMACTHTA